MSILEDPEFKKRINKYEKIITDKEQKYNNYCAILKIIYEYEPKNDIEKVMRRFIFLQNEMLKDNRFHSN